MKSISLTGAAIGIGALTSLSLALAAWMLADHFAVPEALWRDPYHDRNTHLGMALNLALSVSAADVPRVLEHLGRFTVWPPLHGVLLALTLVASGMDDRLAILPSLFGWCVTVVLCGVLAHRLLRGRPGLLAGAVAAGFALTSPAFRLLGSDVMLEGLGSALGAACMLAWLRCAEAPRHPGRWRLLSFLLTLLFLEKYNYWALAVTGLVLGAAPEHWRRWLAVLLVSTVHRPRPGQVLRDPLLIAAAMLAALVIAISLRGATEINLFDRSFSLYPPGNVVTLAYGMLAVRVALGWRAHRAALSPLLGPAGLILLRGHVLPVMLWLLVPFVLHHFLWFLGGNYVSTAGYNPWKNLLFQATGFSLGFHPAPWAAVLALSLAITGVAHLLRRRVPPGARALPCFLLICMAAVVLHPQQQWRFQATALFAFWVCAGVGAATLLQRLAAVLPLPVRLPAAVLMIMALIGGLALQPVSPVAAVAAIRATEGPTDLLLAAAYRPFVTRTLPIGFISTLGRNDLFEWTVRVACRCPIDVDQPMTFADRSRRAVADTVSSWLASTRARRIIVVDAPPRYEIPALGLTRDQQAGQLDAMARQDRFVQVARVSVPDYPAEIGVWEAGDAPGPRPPPYHLIAWSSATFALIMLAALFT